MITLDFEYEISPGFAGSYPVVARAPGGKISTVLRWSLTPAELDDQLTVIKDKVLVSAAVMRRAATGDEQPVRALYVADRQRARESHDHISVPMARPMAKGGRFPTLDSNVNEPSPPMRNVKIVCEPWASTSRN